LSGSKTTRGELSPPPEACGAAGELNSEGTLRRQRKELQIEYSMDHVRKELQIELRN
jgi:hypothetical protein